MMINYIIKMPSRLEARRILAERGLTIRAFARKLDVSERLVSGVFRKRQNKEVWLPLCRKDSLTQRIIIEFDKLRSQKVKHD